jgi:hypothetical protein
MGTSVATASPAVGWGNAREAAGRRLPDPRLQDSGERPKRAYGRFLGGSGGPS